MATALCASLCPLLPAQQTEPTSPTPSATQQPETQQPAPQQPGPQGPPQSEEERNRALEEALGGLDTGPAPQSTEPTPGPPTLIQSGTSQLKLIDISLDVLIAAGSSTEPNESLRQLEGGGHDPRNRGFTVQNVELSVIGAVDPYFDAESHIVYFIDPANGESNVELEEAFLTTRALPDGLQVKAGQFFTEFGRINPRHPHQWDWETQPIILTRLFGPDGMRGPGARVSWLTPLPWYSELYAGVQTANGETMASFFANQSFFDERAIGGRPFEDPGVHSLADLVYLARWENSWDFSDATSTAIGLSALFGPNATGSGGDTQIYGTDVVVKWRPGDNFRGWPFLIWQSEAMTRRYHADSAVVLNDPSTTADDVTLPSDTLWDWGAYSEVLWGFSYGWAVGVRGEYADGNGPGFDPTGTPLPSSEDPFRDQRYRISPLLVYHPTEYSRLRLQYDYDHAQHLAGGDAHSVWLGVEVLFGQHPAHKY